MNSDTLSPSLIGGGNTGPRMTTIVSWQQQRPKRPALNKKRQKLVKSPASACSTANFSLALSRFPRSIPLCGIENRGLGMKHDTLTQHSISPGISLVVHCWYTDGKLDAYSIYAAFIDSAERVD